MQKEEQIDLCSAWAPFRAAVSSWKRCVLRQLPELPSTGWEQDDGPVKHLGPPKKEGGGTEMLTGSSPSFGSPGKMVPSFPKGDVKGHALCRGFYSPRAS